MQVHYQMMGKADLVDVTVSISQEMRALRRSSAMLHPPSQMHEGKIERDADYRRQGARSIRLRRDGERPFQFFGKLLFETVGHWTNSQVSIEQGFSLYVDQDHRVITALALWPNGNTPLRPVHWVDVTEDQDALQGFVDRWCCDVLKGALASNRSASIQDARIAFHSMTAHNLRVVQPQNERKEPCLH